MKPIDVVSPHVNLPAYFSTFSIYFLSSDLIFEDGTTGFFLFDSCFFLRFSLLRGLLSPMATFSLLVCGLDVAKNQSMNNLDRNSTVNINTFAS